MRGAALFLAAVCHLLQTAHAQEAQPGTPGIALSPASVVTFALGANPALLRGQQELVQAQHARSEALAALLPRLSTRYTWTRLAQPPQTGMEDIRSLRARSSAYSAASPAVLTGDSLLLREYVLHTAADLFELVPSHPDFLHEAGLTITQPLFAGGALLNNYRAASYRALSTARSHEHAEGETRLQALTLFWEYAGAQQEQAALRDELIWHEQTLREQEAAVAAGVLVEEDALGVRTALGFVHLQLLRAGNHTRTRREELLAFCNLPPDTSVSIDATVVAQLSAPVQPLIPVLEEVLRNRNDLAAFEFHLQALGYTAKGMHAAYLPSAVLSFDNALRNSDRFHHGRLVYEPAVSLRFDWLLFDWGAHWHRLQGARARLEQHRTTLDEYSQSINLTLRRLLRDAAESLEAEKLALQTAGHARRALELAQTRYREGMLTATGLLEARSQMARAGQELIRVRIEKLLAAERLSLAAGVYPHAPLP